MHPHPTFPHRTISLCHLSKHVSVPPSTTPVLCMSLRNPNKSNVQGMIRSRKLLVLTFLIATAIFTTLWLRDPYSIEESTQNLLHGHHAHEENRPVLPASSLSHPIHKLVAEADGNFTTVLARQSRSLGDAVAEYRRRYRLPSPRISTSGTFSEKERCGVD